MSCEHVPAAYTPLQPSTELRWSDGSWLVQSRLNCGWCGDLHQFQTFFFSFWLMHRSVWAAGNKLAATWMAAGQSQPERCTWHKMDRRGTAYPVPRHTTPVDTILVTGLVTIGHSYTFIVVENPTLTLVVPRRSAPTFSDTRLSLTPDSRFSAENKRTEALQATFLHDTGSFQGFFKRSIQRITLSPPTRHVKIHLSRHLRR